MRFVAYLLSVLPLAAQEPPVYLCHRAAETPAIDGKIESGAWAKAPWTSDFIDIQGPDHTKPRFRTRAKLLWDAERLYIGAQMEELDLSATLTAHDSVIFHDNDFEVFLKPLADRQGYFEFEINALNTSWDLYLDKPYKLSGKADNSWDIPGLTTAVSLDGTLNDPRDRDRGWSVAIAIPWRAFASRLPVSPPHAGGEWRANFSRVEWRYRTVDGRYEKVPNTKEDNWVWAPQFAINMHIPEHWGVLRFVD